MRKIAFLGSALLVSATILFSQNSTFKSPLNHTQYAIITDETPKGDFVGTWDPLYVVEENDTTNRYSYEITSNPGGDRYAIKTGGEVYLKNNNLLAVGEDTVLIKSKFDTRAEIDTLFVRIVDEDATRFIDTKAYSDGNGTRTSPYKYANKFNPESTEFKYWLLKRGTKVKNYRFKIIRTYSGLENDKKVLASYGSITSVRPVIDRGTWEMDSSLRRNYGDCITNNADNWSFYELTLQNGYSGLTIGVDYEQNDYSENILISDIEMKNCYSPNGLLYFKTHYKTESIYKKHIHTLVSDVHIHDNIYDSLRIDTISRGHGIKVEATDVTIENAKIHDCPNVGLSVPTHCAKGNFRYILSYDNGRGSDPSGQHITIESSIFYKNYHNISIEDYASDTILIRNCLLYDGHSIGVRINTKSATSIKIENNRIYNNKKGITISGDTLDQICIDYNLIYNNIDTLIKDTIINNTSTKDTLIRGTGILVKTFNSNLNIRNNTFYHNKNDDIINLSGKPIVVTNNIGKLSNDKNLILTNNFTFINTDIFVDVNKNNFQLNNDYLHIVDAGEDWGQTQDISGNLMSGRHWDIGAFEYFKTKLKTETVELTALKDAVLLHIVGYPQFSETPYGDRTFISSSEWTYKGKPYAKKSLIDFDFKKIPENAVITKATLYLYAYGTPQSSYTTWHCNWISTNNNSGYKQNASNLSRVISDWNEKVTWNYAKSFEIDPTHSVKLPESKNYYEDYVIGDEGSGDIKPLIQDIVDNNNSHGLVLELINKEKYAQLMFCSKEHPDPDKHPKLIITYKVDLE